MALRHKHAARIMNMGRSLSQYLKALIQNIAVVINQSFIQRTTKSIVVHRVALKPMRPQSADTSHWNFYCNDSHTIFCGRSLLHVSLFAPMFFLFFKAKKGYRAEASALPTFSMLSACSEKRTKHTMYCDLHEAETIDTTVWHKRLLCCERDVKHSTQRRTGWMYETDARRHRHV